ncbi:MAG TPA: molybdenum cofactor guanylyltransferase [Gemmatimonadaceae bacterium]|nr:molybdenum cofactor guanylyltransferase [Gemmatimonadaceae bacterium]
MNDVERSCVGVLLAGGAARRFGGQPKGLARLDGVRIADRVLTALRRASTAQLVIANDPAAAQWFPGERVIADETPGLGPLGGLTTALQAAEGSSVLVVAWDMPFVTAELLCELRRRGESGAHAVVPVHGAEGWAEPLCAWYAPSALPTCRALLEAGARRAGALLDALLPAADTVGDEELERFGDPARLFISVDTPDALAALGGTLGSPD